MNALIQRAVAAVAMTAVTLGATAQWGVPKIGYQQPENAEIVMTIDGSEVSREEFSYFLTKMYSSMEAQGYSAEMFENEATGPALVSYLFETAEEQEKMWHTIINEFDRMGGKIDRMTLEAANQMKQDAVAAAGGREAFLESLDAQGLSERLYDNSLAITVYMQMIYEGYYGDEGAKISTAEQRQYFDDNYVICKHILFARTDDDGEELDEAGLAEKQAKAAEVLAELNAGGDFETLMNENTEDTGALLYYPDGYVLTDGSTTLTEFYEAAKALEIGAYSDVVETELGWSIIYRCEPTDEIFENYSSDVITAATGSDFYTELTTLVDAAEVVRTDAYGDATSFENLMTYVTVIE